MSLNNSEDNKDKTEGDCQQYLNNFSLDEREASESWEDDFLSEDEVSITISLLLVS